MAGELDGFDATEFRAGIRTAMVAGLPNAVAMRPTFIFRTRVVATAQADVAGNPYSWQPAPGAPVEKQVPCAVEVQGDGVVGTAAGSFGGGAATLTFLDQDFEQVRGFSEVRLSGDTYTYVRQLPELGLGTVTVHRVLVQARSET